MSTNPADLARMQAEVEAFHRYTATASRAPTAQPPEHFKSAAAMTQAMSDPRYRTDDAYRADVSQKIAASESLGIALVGTQQT